MEEQDEPLSDSIAKKTAKLLPKPKSDARTMPGVHLSLFWGLVRLDINDHPPDVWHGDGFED